MRHLFILFDMYLNFSIRYHVVVQETKEENRMVSKNLTDILNSAANHLCAVEVCDGFACNC